MYHLYWLKLTPNSHRPIRRYKTVLSNRVGRCKWDITQKFGLRE